MTNDLQPEQQNRNEHAHGFDRKSIFFAILQAASIYFFFSKILSKKQSSTQKSNDNILSSKHNSVYMNLQLESQAFDIEVYLASFSDTLTLEKFHNKNLNIKLLQKETNFIYNMDKLNNRHKNITIKYSKNLHQNGKMYAHIFFYRNRMSPFSQHHNFDKNSFSKVVNLVEVRKKKLKKETKRLLNSNKEKDDDETAKKSDVQDTQFFNKESINDPDHDDDIYDNSFDDQKIKLPSEQMSFYYVPSLSIRLIFDRSVYSRSGIPEQIKPFVNIHPEKEAFYFPIFYHDTFQTLKDSHIELNQSIQNLPLLISYSPISLQKWQLQSQFEQSLALQKSMGTATEDSSDDIRKILLESNPYFLAITMIVSVFHMIFDFLAFKNDIKFWKDQKDFAGLSVRTIFLNCFCSIIIFLYLWENETSMMILASSFVGILIEFWKIRKSADITYGLNGGWFNILPWIKISDKASYAESGTSEYDRQAMRYLSYCLYPLVLGYSIYSLFYKEYSGQYQWILSSLVGSVYTFGFITMCPQLYINYKLKSVAHLPWRMMTYKALNTVIDDLFAFVISMPTLHRISCFRDDVVFAIFLYQRQIYRTDYSRTNEFGYTPTEELQETQDNNSLVDTKAIINSKDLGDNKIFKENDEDGLPKIIDSLKEKRE